MVVSISEKAKTIPKSVKQTRLPESVVQLCPLQLVYEVILQKFCAALTSVVKVSPERTISLTKAKCLRG